MSCDFVFMINKVIIKLTLVAAYLNAGVILVVTV